MHFPFDFRHSGRSIENNNNNEEEEEEATTEDYMVEIFDHQLIVEMNRPYINGRPVDESTWIMIKKIIMERCMACFPVHYPALYIRLHYNKLTTRAITIFRVAMKSIKDKGCPCNCHLSNDVNSK